jgi:isopentenyldiphosphate isomerase
MHLDWGSERHLVHADGDYHGAVHVWIYVESTGELLLQKRADRKDSWPGLWDISSAGHISAGDTSLITARQAPRPSPFVCVCVCVCEWLS